MQAALTTAPGPPALSPVCNLYDHDFFQFEFLTRYIRHFLGYYSTLLFTRPTVQYVCSLYSFLQYYDIAG